MVWKICVCFFLLVVGVFGEQQKKANIPLPSSHVLVQEGPREPSLYDPYIGNGYVATRLDAPSFYINGLYNGGDGNATIVSHRAALPSPLLLRISTKDGGEIPLVATVLDIEIATVSKIFEQKQQQQQKEARVTEIQLAHGLYSNLFVHHLYFESAENTPTTFVIQQNHTFESDDFFTLSTTCDSSSFCCWTGTTKRTETEKDLPAVASVCTSKGETQISLAQNSTFSLTLLTTMHTDLNGDVKREDDPLSTADAVLNATQNDFQSYSLKGWEQLEEEHQMEWKKRWQSGLVSAGNTTFAQQLNSSMYYLLASINPNWHYGISPGGLSTNDYNGHMFWDQETWMFPSIFPFYPDLGESLLQYRTDRLDTAQEKAKEFGYEGAMFPWESAYTGVECCPYPNPEGQLEIHINGDIPLAIKQYYYASHDNNWLESMYPLLYSISEFWASRVVEIPSPSDPSSSLFTLYNVQPPDESAGMVNSSVYTNAVCSMTLNFTMEAHSIVGGSMPPDQWSAIANNMYYPIVELKGKEAIHNEYDGYDGHIINQDDVGLLQYPLDFEMPKEMAIRDLIYWQNKTNPDGYFTGDSAYSIAWLQLGNTKKAEEEFNKSFLHMVGDFFVWKEKLSGGNINFLTGAGGFLQNVMYGYGGLHFTNSSMSFRPVLPDLGLSYLQFKNVSYSGGYFSLTIYPKESTAELLETSPSSPSFTLTTNEDTLEMKQGTTYNVTDAFFSISPNF